MRQTVGLTSTYSSDEFGICSALYELGGMVVMHDASGCNSTYTTHDEPRWYEQDSMIFISAISEAEAIMGDDEKFIQDLIETANELHPKFIAIVGAPIPYMIGTDLGAIAQMVTAETGIACFGMDANGMHHYTTGISMALECLVKNFVPQEAKAELRLGQKDAEELVESGEIKVNILGATPLDFAPMESVNSIQDWMISQGMKPGVCLAMGCCLEDVAKLPQAQVNLVVSYGGLAAAQYLEQVFDMPYVVGIPVGEQFPDFLKLEIQKAADTGKSAVAYVTGEMNRFSSHKRCAIIGESVMGASLATAIMMETGMQAEVLCPVDTDGKILRFCDHETPDEDDLMELLPGYDIVIADPMYQNLIDDKKQVLYPVPHTAFSGRAYEAQAMDLIGDKWSVFCTGLNTLKEK